jgi:UPF0755 protein
MQQRVRRITRAKVKRYGVRLVLGCIALLVAVLLGYSHYFGPADADASAREFVVEPGTSVRDVAAQAQASGLVKSAWALRLALLEEGQGSTAVRAGGYTVSPNMDAITVAQVLTRPPALAFVTFPPSIRKEQMGDILAEALGWNEEQKKEWNTVATNPDPDFTEGVYYPDT